MAYVDPLGQEEAAILLMNFNDIKATLEANLGDLLRIQARTRLEYPKNADGTPDISNILGRLVEVDAIKDKPRLWSLQTACRGVTLGPLGKKTSDF